MPGNAERVEWAAWLPSPLLRACRVGNADLVDKLLDAGAGGSNRGFGGDSHLLLHAAARGGSERVVLAVLNAGAKPDIDFKPADTEPSHTALQMAVHHGNTEAARVLMTAGADVAGALEIAIQEGHERLALDLLLAGADPNDGGRLTLRPNLVLASERGYERLVSALLLKGADHDARASMGDTALRRAAFEGRVSAVKALLAGGLPFDRFNLDAGTPLHSAVSSKANAAAVIGVLVAAGANAGVQDCSQPCGPLYSPLHLAAKKGNHEAALALLQNGADVHAAFAPNGWRAIHFACRFSHGDVLELLLRWGADETAVGR